MKKSTLFRPLFLVALLITSTAHIRPSSPTKEASKTVLKDKQIKKTLSKIKEFLLKEEDWAYDNLRKAYGMTDKEYAYLQSEAQKAHILFVKQFSNNEFQTYRNSKIPKN